jgi:hypothetical protein
MLFASLKPSLQGPSQSVKFKLVRGSIFFSGLWTCMPASVHSVLQAFPMEKKSYAIGLSDVRGHRNVCSCQGLVWG